MKQFSMLCFESRAKMFLIPKSLSHDHTKYEYIPRRIKYKNKKISLCTLLRK